MPCCVSDLYSTANSKTLKDAQENLFSELGMVVHVFKSNMLGTEAGISL